MKISAVILAAGFSTRMGAFKPLLPVAGACAVARCAQAVSAAGSEDIIVVTGHCRESLEAAFAQGGGRHVRFVHNDRYPEGMFSSVCAGVAALSRDTDGFFLLPADACAVSAENLAALIEAFGQNGGSSVAYPTHGNRRGHPPLIPSAFVDGILTYGGDGGLNGFLRQQPSLEVEMPDAGVLMDMDTPEDYADMLAYLNDLRL